ncbi:MAG: nucleotide exchange factor GrpE [Myxococcales bacterium]|nr:nucleotide exchange factor GrpE [Myxococcales bacterium]
MNGDPNGSPDGVGDATIPVEVVEGEAHAGATDAATDAANDAATGAATDPPSAGGAVAPASETGAVNEAAADGELARLQARVEALEGEKKDYWDKLLRTAADLENLRKRQRRELDDTRHDTKQRVLKEILPVADNLERALAVSTGEPDAVLDGVRLVQRQLLQALERLEVVPIEAEGQPFDPNLHEAISQQESDAHAPGTVMTVLQRGYKSGDRLLRPAMVVVAKAKAKVG